jgi:hypothetical protein
MKRPIRLIRCRWFLFLGATLLFAMSSAANAACWRDAVDRRSGNLLAMRSGAVYRVLEDPARTAFWLPLTRLAICDQVVVNAMGEAMAIYEIRNEDDNELVTALRHR